MKSQPVIVRAVDSDSTSENSRQTTTLEIVFRNGKRMHIVFDGSDMDIDPWFLLDIVSVSMLEN
ncbi:MAG: hypothetical protein J0I17_12350 ['Candidatus Kapabacteria' thiocyanatum]|nr:hypothetical protein ['Candidatus Kapabacteria' thiocyanatum]